MVTKALANRGTSVNNVLRSKSESFGACCTAIVDSIKRGTDRLADEKKHGASPTVLPGDSGAYDDGRLSTEVRNTTNEGMQYGFQPIYKKLGISRHSSQCGEQTTPQGQIPFQSFADDESIPISRLDA
jgi:hypothetical protein